MFDGAIWEGGRASWALLKLDGVIGETGASWGWSSSIGGLPFDLGLHGVEGVMGGGGGYS